jgi:hypothetical protein
MTMPRTTFRPSAGLLLLALVALALIASYAELAYTYMDW